jgi:hypothetical protein
MHDNVKCMLKIQVLVRYAEIRMEQFHLPVKSLLYQ